MTFFFCISRKKELLIKCNSKMLKSLFDFKGNLNTTGHLYISAALQSDVANNDFDLVTCVFLPLTQC